MEITSLSKDAHYSAALYMRLSKDDEGAGESASIVTQRKMLRAYAQENHYTIYDEYIDDGISGTTFERPSFKRMLRDIEDKKVNLVITKDLSRLGRDYILTGQYTEVYFPSKKVRYIAINDGYDSDSPYTDIAPFKNVINEMYARDISKKIRSAFLTRMKEGAFVGAFAPYGYQRDPENKHHLIREELAAGIVREIFQSAAQGMLPIQIARKLNERKVLTPLQYREKKHATLLVEQDSKPKKWTSGTIVKILRNVVYLGHMAQGKTTKVSFKSNATVYNPQETWVLVKNTHEPLVSREVFDLASRRSKQRTCEKRGQFQNMFSGIAKCAECGRNMSTVGTRRKGAVANLACGSYKLHGSRACSNHFMAYEALYAMVLSSIQELIHFSEEEKQEILEAVQKQLQKQLQKQHSFAPRQKERSRCQKRLQELDILIEKLYEDYAQGVLHPERMKKLLSKYEAESGEIQAQLEILQEDCALEKPENSIKQLKKRLDSYINPTELTPELLYHLIDHIEVGQGIYQKGECGKVKQQAVKIFFRFQGTSRKKIDTI